MWLSFPDRMACFTHTLFALSSSSPSSLRICRGLRGGITESWRFLKYRNGEIICYAGIELHRPSVTARFWEYVGRLYYHPRTTAHTWALTVAIAVLHAPIKALIDASFFFSIEINAAFWQPSSKFFSLEALNEASPYVSESDQITQAYFWMRSIQRLLLVFLVKALNQASLLL